MVELLNSLLVFETKKCDQKKEPELKITYISFSVKWSLLKMVQQSFSFKYQYLYEQQMYGGTALLS